MISFLLESVNEDFLIKYQKKLTFLQNKSMVMKVTIDYICWKLWQMPHWERRYRYVKNF